MTLYREITFEHEICQHLKVNDWLSTCSATASSSSASSWSATRFEKDQIGKLRERLNEFVEETEEE